MRVFFSFSCFSLIYIINYLVIEHEEIISKWTVNLIPFSSCLINTVENCASIDSSNIAITAAMTRNVFVNIVLLTIKEICLELNKVQ
jgi:hypothetical protein